MLPKPNVDASRLLSAEAKRSPEMEALWQWMLAEDSGLPNPETLPMNEPRLTEAQGRLQLEAFRQTWHNRAEWEARAENVRRGMRTNIRACFAPKPEAP